jgi:phage gp46-like protein
MAVDLAIDYNTGDLIVAPHASLDIRTGARTIEQRIRVRLRVWAGEWDLDPSLGSRLHDVIRMPNFRAVTEAQLAIREALLPMNDIRVDRVVVNISPKDSHVLEVQIAYTPIEPGIGFGEPVLLTTTLRLGG